MLPSRKNLFCSLLFLCLAGMLPALDTSVIPKLRATDCAEETPARREALDVLQEAADQLSNRTFAAYVKAAPEEARGMENDSLTLYFYNTSFDKILSDLCRRQ